MIRRKSNRRVSSSEVVGYISSVELESIGSVLRMVNEGIYESWRYRYERWKERSW